MVTIGMNYEVLPGKEKEFEEKFNAVLDSFAQGSGHVRTRLYRDTNAPQSYLIHSEWETREAFTEFIRSEEFRAVTDWGKAEILADRPRHRVYGEEAIA